MTIALTEQSDPSFEKIDSLSTLEIVKTINNEDKKIAFAIEKELPQIAKAIDLMTKTIQNGGRIAYFGAGTSGRLGVLDASECPVTFGVDKNLFQGFIAGGDKALRTSIENAEDSLFEADKDFKTFAPSTHDVIIGISASGNAPYVVEVLRKAKMEEIQTIGISSNPSALIKSVSNIFINPIIGPEIITGSSRMKSGTAQKMILNMLSTSVMIKTGKTYKNYMINLNVSNEKLQNRAIRIVSEILKISKKQALLMLEKSQWNVKLACMGTDKNNPIEKTNDPLKEQNLKTIIRHQD